MNNTTLPGNIIDIEKNLNHDNFFGFTCIANMVSNIISVALTISAVVFFVMIVWSGIDWLISGGDKAKIESAQKRITNALIGLVIVAASWAFYQLILNFFGINLANICTANPVN